MGHAEWIEEMLAVAAKRGAPIPFGEMYGCYWVATPDGLIVEGAATR